MKNYILSYHQFENIIEGIENSTQTELSLREAMLNIINFLKERGYSDEGSVDMILQLRHRDEFTINFMKIYVGDDEDLLNSIEKVSKTHHIE